MHRRMLVLFLAVTSAAALRAQGRGMGGQFQPPPDHWMTLDSLVQAVGLTADQKTKVAQPYNALNGVMKDAAARRAAVRQQMQGSFQPGSAPSPEMRARMDSVRTAMEGFQAEADQDVVAIRALLTPEQQAKFDALAKPQLVRRGPPRQ